MGRELWHYDGSGTPELAADIRAGRHGSDPDRLTVYDGALYFQANDGKTGNELWRYDGAEAKRVADINPDTTCTQMDRAQCSANPSFLTVYDGALYFQADDGKNGDELWRYNGSSVQQVADINSTTSCDAVRDGRRTTCSSLPSEFAVYDGALYFQADDGKNGYELWRYDGSTAELVTDIDPGSCGADPCSGRPYDLIVFDNVLYFTASGPKTNYALWKYDGSTTTRVTSPNAPTCAAPDGGAVPCFRSPTRFAQLNGTLYFNTAEDRVWRHDGSTFERVELTSDVDSTLARPYRWISEYRGALYYAAEADSGDVYTQLFALDGTSVRQITESRESLGDELIFRGSVRHLEVYDGALYFSAAEFRTGMELWRYREQ